MRRPTLLLAVLAAGFTLAALAADDKPPAKKSRRPKSRSRVITNEDVKKSKGKVIELPATAEAPQQPVATLSERHTALRIARSAAEERVRAGEAEVAAIEKELTRLERSYFEEDELDVRDGVIARQFEAAREKATAAAAELEAARKALAELPEKP
ncbi:MAG: hypothetical protein WA208_09300 [Thermoanaerobaculia bacterium]